jgi:hypothetical protein
VYGGSAAQSLLDMIRACAIFIFAFSACVFCRAADAPLRLAEPVPLVELGNAGADWQPLFDKLAAQGNVFSHFTENRWFPFKKIPVVLKGEMRLAAGHGMSLHYTQPEDRTMIVDERGLLLRDDRGHSREVPPDPRSGNINAALLPVLRFDQKELAKTFSLHAARAGNAWRLDFAPHDAALAKIVGRIIVWGEEGKVQRLEFRRSDSQRVEIIIDDSQAGVVFSDADQKRFFR